MNFSNFTSRARFRMRREAAARLARRPLVMRNSEPLVSFTFDDFPRSALRKGGAILQAYGVAGTFFTSFGLMGHFGPSGEMFSAADLEELVRHEHEIGCHTYDHYHAWNTGASEFESSIIRNREALEKHLPGAHFRTFSYPLSCPRPTIKRRTAQYFDCCRGGGQGFNSRTADLSNLAAFFIEQSRNNFDAVERLIESTANQSGWLIFATHDVSNSPTRFGCTPAMLEKIIRRTVQAGMRGLPVFGALRLVTGIHAQEDVA